MINVKGYEFEHATRMVYLHCYNPSANHDKVYYLIMEHDEMSDTYCVSALHGRRGKSLRKEDKTNGFTNRWAANSVFDQILAEKIGRGYEVQEDNRYSQNLFEKIPEDKFSIPTSLMDLGTWSHRQYAENPIRITVVRPEFSLVDYALALVPQGKRIITLVEKGSKTFLDEHGGECTMPELAIAFIDFEGDAIFDGVWTGSEYHVFDSPSEKDYRERLLNSIELLNGTVDEQVIKPADVYLTAGEVADIVNNASLYSDKMLIGIKLAGGLRPGQQDKSHVHIVMRPRATLRILSVLPDGIVDLGVDDGLGFLSVCRLDNVQDAEVGDDIVVEYDSWSGYGTLLERPNQLVGAQPLHCSIEQLV